MNVPSGRIVHCELTGPADLRPLERDRPDFHVVGTIINGARFPDTDSPATQPSDPDDGGHGGGATPGELPSTTSPTTAPASPPTTSPSAGARPADVIAALDSIDAALGELQVARQRLHSSTQPSASNR